MLKFLSVVCVALAAGTGGANAITNGGFDLGFDGWDGKVCPFSCNDENLPNTFTNIANDGGNAFVQMEAPSAALSLSSVQIRQTVTIDALNPFLEIDAGFVSERPDVFGSGSANQDDLVVGLTNDNFTQSLFRVTSTSGSATNSAPLAYDVQVTDSGSGPLRYGFKADLSSLAGQTFELYIGTFVEPRDGKQTLFAFDNVRFTAPVTGVPLPPGLLLAGTGALALVSLGRRRA
ncbi:MAG: hypothetical protein AAFR93_07620 [Pseudomonadota bacterium]